MDEPGFHARRRAEKDAELHPPTRSHTLAPVNGENGPEDDRKAPPYSLHIPPNPYANNASSSSVSASPMSAVERTQALPQPPRMEPHLQFMCGPLLRYDTVVNDVWCGAAMIVTADAGSSYAPGPFLTLHWDPAVPIESRYPDANQSTVGRKAPPGHKTRPSQDIQPYDPNTLGHLTPPLERPNQFDMIGRGFDGLGNGNGHARQPSKTRQERVIEGQEIWVYQGTSGTSTFWRFMIQIPLSNVEMPISYSINNGAQIEFVVPAIGQNMRWAAHSCNGFSAGVNQDDFRGPGFQTGYDPLWTDLYTRHKKQPFHCMVGGGDQIYCDGLTRELELQEWVGLKTNAEKVAYQVSDEMRMSIDRFYFNHYCATFRSGVFARCNRSIPMVNMLDDHDLIDGFGSYPEDLQRSPVFSTIGSRGYFYFLLFQQFTVDTVDGTKRGAPHPNRALILGGDGPWIPFPTHSLLTYLGPKVSMLLLDCRAERRKEQVCSKQTYDAVWKQIAALPRTVEHLVVQLGIPIAYPRMNFMEAALDSKYNPLVALGKAGSMGLTGFVNKFNKEAELLDDLNDHWTAKHHKSERNWLVSQLQRVAQQNHLRVTFLSGDVHCAAVGVFKTLTKNKSPDVEPSQDPRYMLNIVTSAIVNTPPPIAVLTMVSYLGKKTHKTMHKEQTDEAMINLFDKDPDGTANKLPNLMGRRNWTSVALNDSNGELLFDIRVERVKGHGETVRYAIPAPPPRWTS